MASVITPELSWDSSPPISSSMEAKVPAGLPLIWVRETEYFSS